MRLLFRRPSKEARAPKLQSARRRTRLQFDTLENRVCPSTVAATLSAGILQITQTSPGGPTNLIIFGDKAAGAGNTAIATVEGGFTTTVNGKNADTFTLFSPGALSAINVTLGDGNNTISVGADPSHVLTLPGTSLNV